MNAGWAHIAGVIVGFLVLLGTGCWLRRAGKPYGSLLLAIHKLVGVAMLVFVIWSAISANKATALSPTAWIVAALAGVALIVLIGTGGALSAMASPPRVARWVHRIVPYMSISLAGLWLYLQ